VFDVPDLDDPRIMVSIPVPVKGRKTPLVLKVPRFDFIDEAQHDAIEEATKKIDTKLVPRKQMRLAALVLLKPFLSVADYRACETLSVGQLNMIQASWGEQSSIPLGESPASADSSLENTEAQSSTTSTPGDGSDSTSDAA
jgi:hypothetical protein